MLARHQGRQAVRAGERLDARQLGCERRQALGFDAGLVHATRVEIADLASGRIGLGGGLFQNRAQLLPVEFGEHIEPSPAPAIGRDRVLVDPIAAREFVEIIAGGNRVIDGARVDDRDGLGRP